MSGQLRAKVVGGNVTPGIARGNRPFVDLFLTRRGERKWPPFVEVVHVIFFLRGDRS
jgi:hypothetical protein